MWVDYRGSLSTVYNDGEISTCGYIIMCSKHRPLETSLDCIIMCSYFFVVENQIIIKYHI